MTEAAQGPVSTFAFSDLAIRSAMELERARAGHPYRPEPLRQLASALTRSAEPESAGAPFKFVEPMFYEPFERLYRAADTSRAQDVEAIQGFLREKAKQLQAIARRKPPAEGLQDLVVFCVALHRELIREMSSEDTFVIRGWGGSGLAAPAGVS